MADETEEDLQQLERKDAKYNRKQVQLDHDVAALCASISSLDGRIELQACENEHEAADPDHETFPRDRRRRKARGRCDVLGVTYLDFGLERYGSEIPGPVLSHLAMAMDNPQDWLEVFGGLLDPRHRALGRAVNGLSALKPGPFEKLLKSLIFSSDPLYQRLGFACLLEAEDEMAFPILAEFPEELAQGTAEDSYRDMRSTFDLRRYFKRASLGYYPIRCLGRGGMGEVYLSTDIKRSHRISALKFLKVPEAGIDPDIIERFKREARVPLLLKHPGVVRVFDYGNQDNLYWIDTDYIHGLTLQEKLQKTGPIALHEAIGIVKQIGSALEYLQRKSIVHRDLKPANVFLGHDPPIAMLGDFGLVQINDEAIQKEVPNYVPTQAQLILGTVGYMSPEQAIAEGTDHSTDLFSLGVIFYEMIAGRLPFRTGSLAEYHRSLFNEEPQPYGQSMTGVVWTVIRKLIQKDPRNRYSGAAELLEALAELEHALHAGGGSLAGDSHTVSLNLQESENLDDGATIVAPVLETPGVAVTGVDGSPAALGPSAHPTSPAGLTPGTLGGVIPTQPAGTAIETPGTIPLPPQVDTASYPPNQALHPGFMPQGPQAGIYPPGYPAPQSAAYPVPGYPTGIQAYPGMPPTGIYPAPGVPGGFYPIQPEMTGPMTTAGGVPGSGPQSVKCLPDPLKCNRCCASLPREGMYCRHCKFDDMPLIPWLVSWGLVVAAFLCVLPVTLQIELPVPYFVANPMLLPFLGVFLFLIGRAMRDSHWLAFVLASIPLFVLPILSLTAFGLLRSTPIGRWPDWLVVNFIQMAGLEGSNVPQELALRWVTSDGLLPYAYASLGLLITGFLMTSRASVDHFGVSRRFRFALIFLSLLVLAVIVRLFT